MGAALANCRMWCCMCAAAAAQTRHELKNPNRRLSQLLQETLATRKAERLAEREALGRGEMPDSLAKWKVGGRGWGWEVGGGGPGPTLEGRWSLARAHDRPQTTRSRPTHQSTTNQPP